MHRLLFAIAATLAPLYLVHVDYVEKTSVAKYEELVSKQAKARNAVFDENKVEIAALFEISLENGQYFSFRPRASMTELNPPVNYSDAMKAAFTEKVAPFDDPIHHTLESHHNEIWAADRNLSYVRLPLAAPR